VKRCRGPYRAAVHARGWARRCPVGRLPQVYLYLRPGRLRNDGTVAKDLAPVSSPVPRKQTVRPCFPSGRPAMIGLAVSCGEPFTTVVRCGRRRPGSAAARVMHYEDQTTTRIGLITGRWRANRADKRLCPQRLDAAAGTGRILRESCFRRLDSDSPVSRTARLMG
jgi:hypothetical protein